MGGKGKENREGGQRANVRVTAKLRYNPSASDHSDCMNLSSQWTHFHDRQCLWLEALHTGCACAGQRLPVLAKDFLSAHSEKGDGEDRIAGDRAPFVSLGIAIKMCEMWNMLH
ncbi:Hypothetical predicted protein [Podarcis lilfordi]|uniref:Uncharacterized protein n=1 Tax=Podarcis lilfordi TaxID=74358 RepID=A0AA35KYT5_9SAUR|nr:Hypothetical predicted protein [Podarcis lilfordi]